MLSQTAEYALRAVVWLAQHDGEPQTVLEIAKGMRVSPTYLSKVMQTLARAGTVQGQRGRLGGFLLTTPIAKLTIYEVVNAVDPFRRIKSCPLGLPQHCDKLCPLHTKLDSSLAAIENDFKSTYIADLLEEHEVEAAAHA